MSSPSAGLATTRQRRPELERGFTCFPLIYQSSVRRWTQSSSAAVMAEVVAGFLTSAVVKIAGDKLSSAIAEQGNLASNFSDHLEDMKDTMESIAAVLKDAEKKSVETEQARLWLKRLKNAAQGISDMMDNYQDQRAQQMPTLFSYLKAGLNKMVLANEMKNMREELRKINEEARNFNFTVNVGANQEQEHYDRRETAAAVYETTHILGREGEKKKIIDILSASLRKDGTMVLPIYGLGGMGKTTLAQLVYNDTQFKEYEHRTWVYVSQEFDLKKIGRSIISKISQDAGQQNLDELEMIRQRLDILFPGKKILIVLDDLWEDNALELDKLKHMLHVEKKGSMVDVLVTTRSESIAKNICTIDEPHKLQPLEDLVCWDIIKRHSRFEHKSNKQNLERIGLDFAKKCRGVPLAAQAIGYILNTEDEAGWLDMNKNNIWNDESTEVLPSLRLSYERMLPILRLCFSYCAIFPKGHDISEDGLIYHWISLDFIEKPSDGKKYIKQLLGMSFLQYSKQMQKPSHRPGMPVMLQYYTMHDLVHELARSVLDDELIVIDAANKSSNTREHKYCRYAVLTNYDGQTKLSNILPKKVRALHFSSSCQGLVALHDDSFSFTKCLRILDFSGCSGIMLPSSTGQLNKLKCLIAPNLQNERLPDSIVHLTKLQHLNLRRSSLMSALPESIGGMKSLMHLDISDCFKITVLLESHESLVHLDMADCFEITVLPESLGGLKSLVHLNMHCSGITILPESLGELKSLVYLDMSDCFGITILPESLGELKSLVYLDMSSCHNITVLPESLGRLKNLVHLDMSYISKITVLPESFGELKSLVHLNMTCCTKITIIPELLGELKSLMHLDMSGCNEVYVHPESIGGLKSLVHLDMSHCSEIITLPESLGELKSLAHLGMKYCQKITVLPGSLSELKILVYLDISNCTRISALPKSVGGLKSLVHLDMTWCRGITILPESLGGLKSLVHLKMSCCTGINVLPESFGELESLVHLDMSWCYGITILPESLGGLKSLVHVDMSHCSRITVLPESLGGLKSLVHLKMSYCTGITVLPESFGELESLVHLDMSWCYGITILPESLGRLKSLVHLDMSHCSRITVLPESLGGLKSLVHLKMSCCTGITILPESFGELESLVHLDMSWCYGITILPESLGGLKSLVHLDMPHCSGITVLPESLGGLKNLVRLDMSSCSRITVLPESFGELESLVHLKMSWCEGITVLSESLGGLKSLVHLDMSWCEGITVLPESLGGLKSLVHLDMPHCSGITVLPEWTEKFGTS